MARGTGHTVGGAPARLLAKVDQYIADGQYSDDLTPEMIDAAANDYLNDCEGESETPTFDDFLLYLKAWAD